MTVGFVSLVGAGPGDPELITVGAVARLAEADVVVYDRLANPALLRHAFEGAELVDVGKTPARHTMSQEEINALLVERGLAGQRVVRLKGGDPFVFGRGGEEAEALAAAGVPFEVLPGVTSAVAAPAYAGIPVTHRGVASSFAVITGHEDPAKEESSIDWARIVNGADTLVFLMGTGRLAEIARRLIEHGRAPETPAAVIEWGTLPRQRTVVGTLATIADEAARAGIEPPAVTVVGEVARLREDLRWFDTRPLFGKRVLVTRTRQQASELSRALAALGAEPVELPTIEIVPRFSTARRLVGMLPGIPSAEEVEEFAAAVLRTAEEHSEELRELEAVVDALRTSAYQWCVFTSANAVELFCGHLRDFELDARAFGRAQIAAIGPGTAAALASEGLRADLLPERYVAEGLLDEFGRRPMRGQRVLLPRAEGAREALVDGLAAMGAEVDELILYRAEVPRDSDAEGLRRLRAGEIDVATFASSSSVRNLIQMLDGDVTPLHNVLIAAIGPVTAEAVREAGLECGVVASKHTIGGLVAALRERFPQDLEPES